MIKRGKLQKAVRIGALLAIVCMPLLSGCTAMASKEQLQTLEEAKRAAEAAEADLNACRQRKAEVERQMAQKKDELSNLQNDRETVQKALQQ